MMKRMMAHTARPHLAEAEACLTVCAVLCVVDSGKRLLFRLDRQLEMKQKRPPVVAEISPNLSKRLNGRGLCEAWWMCTGPVWHLQCDSATPKSAQHCFAIRQKLTAPFSLLITATIRPHRLPVCGLTFTFTPNRTEPKTKQPRWSRFNKSQKGRGKLFPWKAAMYLRPMWQSS